MATIADVTGKQYLPGTNDYADWSYQYASSTHAEDHDMKPGLIVQPRDKKDIGLVLQYAKSKKIAVAIRTGGHQYSGASSTSQANIQLDLRSTFQAPDDRVIFEKDGKSYVRTSVSWSLGDFNAYLTKNKLFVPHGQCTEVHLGGHVQTGGYGQLGRSFGLLGDHVISLEVVDHEGNPKEITQTTDPDLFFALLGGSPGNLGVLTHFTIHAHRDVDYQGSRGFKGLYWYNKDTLKRLLGYLAEMSDNYDFPRNYDFCVSVLSSSFPLLDLWPELDNKMRIEHPEIYGKDDIPFWPRSIVVYAQWVPFSPTDKCDDTFFSRLQQDSISIEGVQTKPMSELTGDWIFRNTREFKEPYVKRTYATASTTLGKDGWPAWVADRIDAIVAPEANRCWLSAQLQSFGGRNSQFTANGASNTTAYSWRDSTIVATLDCFHDPAYKTRAEDWEAGNDKGVGSDGIFSKQERRLLWGSYGEYDLDKVWNAYFETREKYERLRQVRARVDPDGVFTPNAFCVKAAEGKQGELAHKAEPEPPATAGDRTLRAKGHEKEGFMERLRELI